MPLVYIQLHKGKDPTYKKAVSDGIHAAMVDVLGVPDDTWDQFFNEYRPGDMVYDPQYFGLLRGPRR